MTETLHLGCGTNIKPNAHNVDILDLDGVDETVDLSEIPWSYEDNSWSHIVAEHVFEHLPDMQETLAECARILKPGGTLRVVFPIGQNAIADPDHQHQWIWDTAEYYCGKRHWDVDVGLDVVERDVSLHTHFPDDKRIDSAYLALINKMKEWYGQGRWMFDLPITSGEFTVVFQK